MKITVRDNRYTVYITQMAKRKMELYCSLCDKEIGWLSLVEKMPDNQGYLITDCILLRQKVHSATTEIDPTALLELWNETSPEVQSKIKCWGHSHVNMTPNPSAQDNSQMQYFEDTNEWFIRIITNKKGDLNVNFYDFKNGLEINSDELVVYLPELIGLKEEITKEIEEKVSEITTTTLPAHTYDDNDSYFKKYQKNKITQLSAKIAPLFDDIDIKYLKNIKDALNDPNYWSTPLIY